MSRINILSSSRLADRIGIIGRLLTATLVALLIAVAAVQVWTLRAVEANGLQREQDALKASMALLHHDLAPFGSVWSATADGQLLLGSTRLNGRNDIVDAVSTFTGAAATIFLGDMRIATNVRNTDGSRGLGTRMAAGPAHDAALLDGQTFRGRATILGVPYLTIYEPIRDVKGQSIGILFVGISLTNAQNFMSRITQQAAIGALVIALMAGAAYYWMLCRTMRPLRTLSNVMHRIADGVLDCSIPGVQRVDQIGDMARALLQLRDASARSRSLEQEAGELRTRSEAEKRAALVGMADRIETETMAGLHDVATRTATMTTTADEMSASATRTGTSAEAATAASAQAMANARAVASAAEELSASIREIDAQVAHSTNMVGRAVAAGGEARATIEALNEEVARIGAVADMIGEIAARTNLLALNATIEAARVGEAGKGFAVVAAEVKALATQTAHSTEDIGRHIAQVRGATSASVAAVQRIEQTIREISAIAGSIAAAIEQQAAATAEISRNVTETASTANSMTQRTTEVSAEAMQTGIQAADVRESAMALNAAVGELGRSVIRVVRTAAA